MNIFQQISDKFWRFYRLPDRLEAIQEALGRIEARQNKVRVNSLHQNPRTHEFKVYSQWGEDGIIDHLVNSISIENKTFIEFGVETYTEANTLFLLKNANWRGLVIDGSRRNIESIVRGRVFWRYGLLADCSFITKDNINEIISRNGFTGDVGLLSVDIDGNDYWVWEAISCVNPRIVISEYNSLFGPTAKISVPYKHDFYRTAAHPSNMYYGASIAALTHLANKRGYSLVAGNSVGNNIFFVRNDCLGELKAQHPEEAYVKADFREARAANGRVQLLDFSERQSAIADLPVVDVVTLKQSKLSELL